MPVIGELKPASMPEHMRMGFEAKRPLPARSTILAKPAGLNGAPRSDVNTKGDLGSCSRCSRRRARSSSPRIGCVLGVPCFTLRTCRVALRSPPDPSVGPPARRLVGHACRRQGPSWRPDVPSGSYWPPSSAARPRPRSGTRASASGHWGPFGGNCSIYGGWGDQLEVRLSHDLRLLAFHNCLNNACSLDSRQLSPPESF